MGDPLPQFVKAVYRLKSRRVGAVKFLLAEPRVFLQLRHSLLNNSRKFFSFSFSFYTTLNSLFCYHGSLGHFVRKLRPILLVLINTKVLVLSKSVVLDFLFGPSSFLGLFRIVGIDDFILQMFHARWRPLHLFGSHPSVRLALVVQYFFAVCLF